MSGSRQTAWAVLALVIGIALVAAQGCSSRNAGKPKQRRVEGIAEKIDLNNNSVSMRVSDGKGGQRILEGTLREDTEVEINGRAAKIEHVRPGDKVVVSGYREGEGENQKLVATKVVVTRPEGDDWKSTAGKSSEKAPEHEPAASQPAPVQPAIIPAAETGSPEAGAANAERVEDRREQPANDNR